MGGKSQERKAADLRVQQTQQQVDQQLAQAQVNPFLTAETNAAGQNLADIRAGRFGGLGLVKAINAAANRARAFEKNYVPLGEEALASYGAGGGGYAQQRADYRRRLLNDSIGEATLAGVDAERSYATGVLFPGAAQISDLQLAKAGILSGLSGQSLSQLQMAKQPGAFRSAIYGGLSSGIASLIGGAGGGIAGLGGGGGGGGGGFFGADFAPPQKYVRR